jgi:hypothetical protein
MVGCDILFAIGIQSDSSIRLIVALLAAHLRRSRLERFPTGWNRPIEKKTPRWSKPSGTDYRASARESSGQKP